MSPIGRRPRASRLSRHGNDVKPALLEERIYSVVQTLTPPM
jgi:hypothetical protein